jgi:HEAT repeat protein
VTLLLVSCRTVEHGAILDRAAEAIANLKPSTSVLTTALTQSDNYWFRYVANKALKAMGWQFQANKTREERLASLLAESSVTESTWEECIAVGSPAVKHLMVLLSERNLGNAREAAKTLVRMRHIPEVQARIREALQGGGYAASPILDSIENASDEQAIALFLAALQSANETVRFRGMYNLKRCAATNAVEPLCLALQDPSAEVRVGAAQALGKIGDSRAYRPLKAAIKKETRENDRREMIQSLALIPAPPQNPIILLAVAIALFFFGALYFYNRRRPKLAAILACPFCHQPIQSSADLAGQMVVCPNQNCGQSFLMPPL